MARYPRTGQPPPLPTLMAPTDTPQASHAWAPIVISPANMAKAGYVPTTGRAPRRLAAYCARNKLGGAATSQPPQRTWTTSRALAIAPNKKKPAASQHRRSCHKMPPTPHGAPATHSTAAPIIP
eukprot:GEMP01073482.1.p1 GENE.GEMP01073482.1~~GEMP01073482.1.p1  ORF type:complete len:124 (+),score=21.17 GEMP01073482.1:413-784(+)